MRPSAKTIWIIVHLCVPLFPFILGVLIRCAGSSSLSARTFSMAELAASLGLAMIFMNQSLLTSEHAIGNKDDKLNRKFWAFICACSGAALFGLFVLVVVFETLVFERGLAELTNYLVGLDCVVLVLSIVVVTLALKIQGHFKLRAALGGDE